MTDREAVGRWLAGYEAAWRAPGTDAVTGIFTDGASYRHSPYAVPVAGLDAIRRMWEEERAGPDEVFTLATEILAVDGPTAVVRVEVRYGDPVTQEYRDLWVMRLDDDGRCTWFEEWPFWPERRYAADSSLSPGVRLRQDDEGGAGGVLLDVPPGTARRPAEHGQVRCRLRQQGPLDRAGRPSALLGGGQHGLPVQHALSRMHPGM